MKTLLTTLLFISLLGALSAQNLYPSSGSVKIYAGTEAWAEGVCVVKPSSYGGFRLTRNDPTTGNYTGNWAVGYNSNTGSDFGIANFEGTVNLQLVTSTGFAGIGTISPTARFHVTGANTNSSVAMKIENIDAAAGSFAPIQFKTGISSNVWQAFARNSDFFVGIAGIADHVVIKSSGNVGIGTSSPDQKFTVNGIIHATRLKLDATVPTPDYVFEKSYALPKLDQVKSYIDENKHLPEVPSAKEIDEKGIDVGEMNMVLLKKVEELTLYIIEQEKRIKALEESKQTGKQ